MKKLKKNKKKSSFRKFALAYSVIAILSAGLLSYGLYSRVYMPNILFAKDTTETYIYIPTNADFLQVVDTLNANGLLINVNSFEWLAKQKNYHTNIKPGRYKIDRALNNNQLVNLLRSGKQTPIKVAFHNLRTKEDLVGKIASQIEADSASILKHITKVIFKQKPLLMDSAIYLDLTKDNVACLFLPNTYEFYWNTSAEEFVNRMLKEHAVFWNAKRKKKATRLKLNLFEVTILASIVEKEQSIRLEERPDIAGLYLNRIRKGMLLQSDPTAIFAIGDFSIKRVLNKHLEIDSPYNTYMYPGLPPGPICLPSLNAIDAVLNANQNNFLFMCAREDFSGYHNFAQTYQEHNINANKYRSTLDSLANRSALDYLNNKSTLDSLKIK